MKNVSFPLPTGGGKPAHLENAREHTLDYRRQAASVPCVANFPYRLRLRRIGMNRPSNGRKSELSNHRQSELRNHFACTACDHRGADDLSGAPVSVNFDEAFALPVQYRPVNFA
jgi:hypothetical protein